MSDDINILLPPSQVDFFLIEAATAASAAHLVSDWRFARVNVNVNQGGIEAAVAHYTQYGSPDILIVETNDISDEFLAQLGQLAAVCAEGTDAVIIGPMNDVHLYRNLIGMGVRDYLVRPVPEHEMISVISKSIVDKRGLSKSRLAAVMGAKGGVGATTVAQLLAWDVAEELKQKTVLLDAAGSGGSLGIAFGLEPATTLGEAVRMSGSGTDDDMKRLVQQSGTNLSVLVSGSDPLLSESPDADAFEGLLNRLMQKYPVVIVDLSSAPRAIQKRTLSIAAHVVMVSTPQLPPLRNCRALMTEIKGIRGNQEHLDLVVNMHGLTGSEEVPLKDIKAALGLEPAAVIDFAPKIFARSEAAGKPVAENKQAHDLLHKLKPLAERLSRAEREGLKAEGGKKGDRLGFLKKIVKK